MANQSQLRVLDDGVAQWNAWRRSNPSLRIDLSRVDFDGWNIPGINLSNVNLIGANLTGASLQTADFSGADLTSARLDGARLEGANFSGAIFGDTHLEHLDLSKALDLSTVKHELPSRFDFDTLRVSRGRMPEAFLMSAGFSKTETLFARLYDPALTQNEITNLTYEIDVSRGSDPIQLRSLFISYSRKDALFVDQLERELTHAGIRFWRDTHDLIAGRLDAQIDRAIHFNSTVVLILSANSVKSDWVEWEVARARAAETNLSRDVLCPISLDQSWLTSDWSGPTQLQILKYNVLDFSNWQDGSALRTQFRKLTEGLKLFYGRSRRGLPLR